MLAYRAHVDDAMRASLDRARSDAALAALIELGLHHEQQHQELILTDVKHLLSRNPLRPALRRRHGRSQRDRADGIALDRAIAAASRTSGTPATGFAFDNEGPRHRVWLEPFELASRPVTNGEFAAFIDDGGYRRPELWLSLGWDAVAARGWDGAALLGARRRRAGERSRCTAWRTSIRTRRLRT